VTLRVIVLFVLMLVVIRAIRLLLGGIAAGVSVGPAGPPRSAPMKLVRDPVCGTHVAPRQALSLTSGETTHYFCSEACRSRFER
jgi:YHS domain-containing protein